MGQRGNIWRAIPSTAEMLKAAEPHLAVMRGVLAQATELRGSTKALAARAGITGSHLSAIIYGRGLPSLVTVISLADALGITPDELLGFSKK